MFIFLLSALLAEALGTFTGFGTTTILVPLASFFIPLKQAIVLVGLFHFFGTFWRTLFFARGIEWRIALAFGIPELVFAAAGAYLLVGANVGFISKLLGAALIAYSLYSLFGHRLKLPRNLVFLTGAGSVAGFLAGLIGTAGALRGAFLTSWNLKKEVYLGTGAAMGLGADLTRVLVYQKTGLLQVNPQFALILAATALVGTFIGVKVVGKTEQEFFAKIVFLALMLAGLRFLFV